METMNSIIKTYLIFLKKFIWNIQIVKKTFYIAKPYGDGKF
jgi:hypothetical protein